MDSLLVAMKVLGNEATYPSAMRFRNAMDLLAQTEQTLITAKSLRVPVADRAALDEMLGAAGHYWLAATLGIRSEAEQRTFLQQNSVPFPAPGVPTFDTAYIRAIRSRSPIAQQVAARIAAAVAGSGRAYAARDIEALSAVTQLGAGDVSRRLNNRSLTFFSGKDAG